MNLETIRDAIEPASVEVVSDIYDVAKEHAKAEADRQKVIEGKAASMLASIGLAMSLCFAFGWQVLANVSNSAEPSNGWHIYGRAILLGAFSVAALCGISSGWCALHGLLITTYRGLNEDNVFNAEVIAASNNDHRIYKQFMALHIWSNATKDGEVHARKARWVERSQKLFFGFIICVVVVTILVYGLRA